MFLIYPETFSYYKLMFRQKYYFLDARSEERFNGTAPEPREGIRRGHINGAKWIFFKWRR